MNASLRALLTGIIDYAGMFPPAALPLPEAIRHFQRYRNEPESWMLARFVCPAGKLAELTPFLEGPPLPLTVLLGEASERDLADRYAATHAVRIDSFEVRAAQWSGGTMDRLLFVEQPASGTPLAGVGFKLRCGGLEAAAFPSVDDIARVIVACRTAGVPLKFTAGLHHPLYHRDNGLGVMMHGFINVFVAGVLAQARHIDEDEARRILADGDASHFRFDEERLCWHELSASVAEIAAARRMVTSFGSCSFDEPRDDLRRLGWL